MTRGAHKEHRHAAVEIVRALRGAGFTAYFAGGCVRDELLGLMPEDYDVATDARPDDVRAVFPRVNEVGAAFGVLLVRAEGVVVEVATFRREGVYSDRRRPDAVEYADAEADARRRDFTINALFLDPLDTGADAHGRVIDFVGGRDDLARRVLRAVGDPDARLGEDHLRALRAVRHSSRLGFEIEPGTANAIHRHARELAGVSRERIGEEVRRMLTHPSRALAAQRMQTLGLDAPALDEPPRAVPTPTLERLPDDAPFPAALGAWTLDRTPGATPSDIEAHAAAAVDRLRRALMLSNDEREALLHTIRGVALLERDWPAMPVAAQKRAAAAPWFTHALAIVRARCDAAGAAVARRVNDLARTPSGVSPAPLLTGDDLIADGFAPGPAFRGLLDAVYDAQLEDRVADKGAALALARRIAGRAG